MSKPNMMTENFHENKQVACLLKHKQLSTITARRNKSELGANCQKQIWYKAGTGPVLKDSDSAGIARARGEINAPEVWATADEYLKTLSEAAVTQGFHLTLQDFLRKRITTDTFCKIGFYFLEKHMIKKIVLSTFLQRHISNFSSNF